MTLSHDILAAADTIDQLNAHMEFGDKSTWNATELRHIARAVKEEEEEREGLVGTLANEIFDAGWGSRNALELAQRLIENGWRPTQ